MAALDRALALAEPEHRAVRVGEELDLDVPRPLEVALEEEPVVAEGRQRLASRRRDGVVELAGERTTRIPRPPPPAAALTSSGKPSSSRRAAGDDGHAGRDSRSAFAASLVAAGAERVRRRADPDEPGGLDRVGEVRALGQEPVAGMDRVGAALARGPHELRRRRGTSAISTRLVGRAGVERAAIVGRGDRDGRDPERARGAEDAQRDLAAVCYEELAEPPQPGKRKQREPERTR